MKKDSRRQRGGGRLLLACLGISIALACTGCSSGGSDSGSATEGESKAVRYDDPQAVLSALTDAGIGCSESDAGTFSYESIGEVPYVSCEPEDDEAFGSEILIVTFDTSQPSRELLDDISESLVVGDSWAISVTGDNEAIADAVGGRALSDDEWEGFPENPS